MSIEEVQSAREVKHVVILEELRRLDNCVHDLHDVVDRLETGNIPDRTEPEKATDISLVQLLDSAPDRLSTASSQLRDIKSKLSSMLF